MKRLFFPLMMAGALFLMHVVIHAQTAVKKQELTDVVAFQKASPLVNSMTTFRNLPIKAVRSFKTTWQHVDNESWYEVPDGYRARFNNNGVLYLVTYNKKGNWLHTLRQYEEFRLDRDIRSAVKSIYFDYNIILVEEIEQAMKPLVYVIHMEDKTRFLNIRVCNGELEEMAEINKL
ncbi:MULTISPECIES: hypothetical protein [Niastella]|uniref:Beta-lactamase-inhibitor-like PepSY-like domain-containing protein n=1 Tax=Niastella soli TaxID=2821487 RepID=A0ABS3Z684_9BACT|nr:hypothetical protein [Niastella soli]MBO9205195.1 hypothetical protein [Niastella soli]